MRVFISRLALRLAFNAVGLRRATVPLFVPAAGYVPLAGRRDAIHVAVGRGALAVHEYSSDFREAPHRVRDFPSLEAFIRDFVMTRIDWACTVYMATVRHDTMEKLKAGQPGEFFAVREAYQQELVRRLDRYLGSLRFAMLAKNF